MFNENKPIFNMIAAYTKEGRILGEDHLKGMPWGLTLAKDMKNFRRLTAGNTLVVGPNTLPQVERLHGSLGRRVMVVASDFSRKPDTELEVVDSLYEAMLMIHADPVKYGDMFVAGGARTYEDAMNLIRGEVQRHVGAYAYLYATEIDGSYIGKVCMPELVGDYMELERLPQMPDFEGGPSYDFVRYRFN